MRRVLDAYYRLLRIALTILMGALIIPVSMQVLSRYTGIIPRYIWTEEIARFCFVWIVMIGAMIAVRDGSHFDVDVLPHSENRAVELLLRLVMHLCVMIAAITFVVYGYEFAVLGSRQISEIASLPMLTIYIAWPLAGATWVVFVAEKIWDEIAAYRQGA